MAKATKQNYLFMVSRAQLWCASGSSSGPRASCHSKDPKTMSRDHMHWSLEVSAGGDGEARSSRRVVVVGKEGSRAFPAFMCDWEAQRNSTRVFLCYHSLLAYLTTSELCTAKESKESIERRTFWLRFLWLSASVSCSWSFFALARCLSLFRVDCDGFSCRGRPFPLLATS